MQSEVIADLTRQLQNLAQFHDGQATVPAYILEQLFIATGLEQEHYYTEEA